VGNSATPIAEQEAIIAALRVRHENAEPLRDAFEELREAIMGAAGCTVRASIQQVTLMTGFGCDYLKGEVELSDERELHIAERRAHGPAAGLRRD